MPELCDIWKVGDNKTVFIDYVAFLWDHQYSVNLFLVNFIPLKAIF